MRSKSEVQVLSVDLQDPNTTRGVVEVCKNLLEYTSVVSECGNVRRKKIVNGKQFKHSQFLFAIVTTGDQGFVEKVQGAIFSRTGESDPKERLSPFIPLPQEFHTEKVGFKFFCSVR